MDKIEARIQQMTRGDDMLVGLQSPITPELETKNIDLSRRALKTEEDFHQFEKAVDHKVGLMTMIVSI